MQNCVLNVRRVDSNNVGDLHSSPCPFFPFPGVIREVDITQVHALVDGELSEPMVVVGGGGLLSYRKSWDKQIERIASVNSRCVIWGAGLNKVSRPGKAREFITVPLERGRRWFNSLVTSLTHGEKPEPWLPKYLSKCKLVGLRDDEPGPGIDWVPCASCMRPEFDYTWKIERKVGVYQHQGIPIPSAGVHPQDCIDNRHFSVEEVLRFIGSSEAVLTSSYHGAYWATLMGKPTVVYRPSTNKFSRLRHQLRLYTGNLAADFAAATTYAGALDECRAANRQFWEKVQSLL